MDDQTDWQRQVLVGLIVLVTVGAVVGGVVALVTIKAADIAGIDDTTANTGIHGPRSSGGTPSEPSDATSSSSASESTPPTSTGPTTPASTGGPSTSGTSRDAGITLIASPSAVSTYDRINLTGAYRAPDGTALQVQRKEGGRWVDFPTIATVDGGTFSTYIETGHAGPNLLRVSAIGGDEVSNTVRVQVS